MPSGSKAVNKLTTTTTRAKTIFLREVLTQLQLEKTSYGARVVLPSYLGPNTVLNAVTRDPDAVWNRLRREYESILKSAYFRHVMSYFARPLLERSKTQIKYLNGRVKWMCSSIRNRKPEITAIPLAEVVLKDVAKAVIRGVDATCGWTYVGLVYGFVESCGLRPAKTSKNAVPWGSVRCRGFKVPVATILAAEMVAEDAEINGYPAKEVEKPVVVVGSKTVPVKVGREGKLVGEGEVEGKLVRVYRTCDCVYVET